MAETLVFGSPSNGSGTYNLRLLEHGIPVPGTSQVLVKMLAAPINPLDLLVLKCQYPVKPQHMEQDSSIPGYDGVAEIVQRGDEVQNFAEGDRVILKKHGLGTWRTHAVFDQNELLKVPKDMDVNAASIVRMSILNAYLLLQNNAQEAHPGDWIIVNAATSTVAHFITRLARLKGLQVISVIRDRDDATKVAESLRRHGSSVVLEERELSQADVLKDKKIILGYDAVFGEAGQRLIGTLSPGATYVTYGFLGGLNAEAKISIDQGLIFLKNIAFRGFRLSSALSALSDEEQEALLSMFSKQLQEGQLTMPLLNLVDWPKDGNVEALEQAVAGADGGVLGQHKKIITFRQD